MHQLISQRLREVKIRSRSSLQKPLRNKPVSNSLWIGWVKMGVQAMPSLLLDVLLFVGQMMAFGPLIALAVYLLLFHGHEEQRVGDWL